MKASVAPWIEIDRLGKSFGGNRALDGVSFDLARGEVHAVVGENGAGKSTLNRILAGVVRADSGEIRCEGVPLSLFDVTSAERAGIAMVHQESVGFLDLDAAQNLFVCRELTRGRGIWLDREGMQDEARQALAALGESFPVDLPLEHLTLAQRQMAGIARALRLDCRLLILDEPSASLSVREAEALFATVRRLRERGVTILYVSHRMDEVFALADRVTILRDGRHIATLSIGQTSREELVSLMVGRADEGSAPTSSASNLAGEEPILSVRSLTKEPFFRQISFELHPGRILGLGGLVGAGRSEIARVLFGLDCPDSGTVVAGGVHLPVGDPRASMARGIAYVPEDRQEEGLHLAMSVRENLSMAVLPRMARWGRLRRGAEVESAEGWRRDLQIRAPNLESAVANLSGGNQQKVLLGKWLAAKPRVLILDEPTRGVDVGAKAEIHQRVRELASSGSAVLFISSDLPELLELSDEVSVIRQGALSGSLRREQATPEKVLELALPLEESNVLARADRRELPRELGVAVLLALMLVAAAIVSPGFLGIDNLRDMLVKVAPTILVGVGLTFVILAREIDISVGALMGLCGAALGLAGSADRAGWPAPAAAGLCLAVGLAGGLANGLLVAYGRIPSIIVTLGTLTIFTGLTERLLGGKWIQNMPDALRDVGTGNWLGIPYPALAAGAVTLFGVWLSLRTPFGIRVKALGSHPEAAASVGLSTRRLQVQVFALTGLLAGVAALFSATQLQVIESGFGKGFELSVVAAVVVGGTSIRGGRGSVAGSVLSALALGIVGTLLIFLKLGETAVYWERAIQGSLILAAILADVLLRRRRRA